MACAALLAQHCVKLSTTEAEYVAMAERVKEGLFVTSVLSFMASGVASPLKCFRTMRGAS